MSIGSRLLPALVAGCSLIVAQAQPWQSRSAPGEGPNPARAPEPVEVHPASEQLEEAREDLLEAVHVVRRMKADPQVLQLLQRAQGLFIVNDYAHAALGVGVQGGEGVLVTRRGNDFGDPIFFNMGALSIGAQAGATRGEIAFLLMTERAVQRFLDERTFSLTAGAGLSFANYQARGMAATGKLSDVVVWTGAPGLYAGINVGALGVLPDGEANRAYYGRDDATALQIASGRIPNPHRNVLAMVLRI
ncbi:lipid-binding SYLF domain-containing protein [Ramlibacter sp. AN1015]|uniref:lipid-binding SYLF domain-containing protein n=1 Tax=Ramlibacter sp. AN1015 TaxID=3133428 RepID=UPI0030BFDD06